MQRVLAAQTFDAVPINTTATYIGDALFVKPIPVILEKTRLIQEAGAKPLIACYTDADVNNAERLLFRSGLVESPSYWAILPALPGCSPMGNSRQMVDGLTRMASAIYDVDPDATILVCAAGRASMYVVTLAAVMDCTLRVGMEDTVWLWPHRNDKVASNSQMLELTKSMAAVVGRDVATHREYREIVGLPVPAMDESSA
jgi:3-keto-5-aminohexanoate cleavage enzyme